MPGARLASIGKRTVAYVPSHWLHGGRLMHALIQVKYIGRRFGKMDLGKQSKWVGGQVLHYEVFKIP